MTTSTGMLGLPDNLAYASAKGGVIGLSRGLATAGAAHDIKVNLIAPAAYTRMASGPGADQLPPELVAPLVAYLAHEDCPGQRRDLRRRRGSRRPHVHRDRPPATSRSTAPLTIEDVAAHWATINDESGYYVPADLNDWAKRFMAHLAPSRKERS